MRVSSWAFALAAGAIGMGACADSTGPAALSAVPTSAPRGDIAGATWSIRPSGLTTISDRAFNSVARSTSDYAGAEGWNAVEGRYPSTFTLASDAAAPLSPASIARATYPTGMSGGQTPAFLERGLGSGQRTVHVGMWVRPSANFSGHSSRTNGLLRLWIAGQPRVWLNLRGAGSEPLVPTVGLMATADARTTLAPNKVASAAAARGEWQRLEVVVKSNSSGLKNGELYVSLGGQLIAEYKDVAFTRSGERDTWEVLMIVPTWGNSGGTVPATMTLDFDHVSVAGATTTAPQVSTGPAAIGSVALTPAADTVLVDSTTQLTASVRDANGTVVTDRPVTWTSSDAGVATVSNSGLVRGVAAGSALVIAAAEGKADTSSILVQAPQAPPPPPPPVSGSGDDVMTGTTVFADGFESGTLSTWQDGVNPNKHVVLNDASLARSGSRVLQVTYPQGDNGGWLTRFFMPGYDSIYVRYWVRLPAGWQGGTKLLHLGGSRIDNQWSAFGKAGRCPSGTDFFNAMLTTTEQGATSTTTPPLRFYTYYPGMRREPDGTTCWGRYGDGTESYSEPTALTFGPWHKVEFWVKLNTPGQRNGAQKFWVDGQLKGQWNNMVFRTTADLRLNFLQLTFNVAAGSPVTQRMYVDDVVVMVPQGSGGTGDGGNTGGQVPMPPAAPTSLSATTASTSQIDLRWADNATDETSYIVERCAGAGCTSFSEVVRLAAGATTYASTGLAASTSYSFRVRASNAVGPSAPSNVATATTQAPPPPTGGGTATSWPNVPSGLPLMRDNPWNALSGDGWSWYRTQGDARIVQDPTAPTGAGSVLELVYPQGFAGGTAPAQLWTGLNSATSSTGRPREMYVGTWWKMGAPTWQGHGTGVNKIQYLFVSTNSNTILTAYGPTTGPWRIINSSYLSGAIKMMEPNVAQVPIYANTWYRLEWHVRYPSTPGGSDGRIRWWVNGQLVGDYAETFPNDAGFVEYKLGSVWGGLGGSKAQEEYMRFDHTVLHGR